MNKIYIIFIKIYYINPGTCFPGKLGQFWFDVDFFKYVYLKCSQIFTPCCVTEIHLI